LRPAAPSWYPEQQEETIMADTPLSLTTEERTYLIQLLETSLKNHRVEEHRTRTPSFREQILQEEKLLEQLLAKLGQPQK
jgi:hypothetical protein